MNVFNRVCKVCGNLVSYTSEKTFNQATKRDSMCRSCRSVCANKSEKRILKVGAKNHMWKGYKEIPYAWFSRYFERKGSRKKRTGTINIQDVYNLWILQNKKCALSGRVIGFCDDKNNTSTCSIDRINSLKEYTIDNIQLVHKDINKMKNNYDNEYFIQVCKDITKFQEEHKLG
jgi:hypothetical protein